MWHFAQAELEQKIKLVHPKNIMMTIHPPPALSDALANTNTHKPTLARTHTHEHMHTCKYAYKHYQIIHVTI